ncbi:hypothetical protein AGMMS50229_05960 [Campylobacterota bacterium]|nr:hypothetical protein AGMMS50229_05960 [Campylobacterota bacterium]
MAATLQNQTFADLIRGLQHAVNTAQEMLQDHQFQTIKKFFKDGNPIVKKVYLPDGKTLAIPWITLVPQSLLTVSEIEMGFTVEIVGLDLKGFDSKARKNHDLGDYAPPRSSIEIAFAHAKRSSLFDDKLSGGSMSDESERGNTIDVKIKFKSIEMPEGTSRLLDALNVRFGEAAIEMPDLHNDEAKPAKST